MKLKSVQIKNFRAIDEMHLTLDRQLTIFHGDNAHGKTSVLRAIAVGLGAIPTILPDVSGIGFIKKDRRGNKGARISLTTFDGINWERTSGLTRSKGWFSRNNNEEPPRHPLKSLKNQLESNALRAWDRPVDLPILVFYDTERAVPNLTKQRGRPKYTPSRYAALSGALSARTSFRELLEWFYSKENEELREQRERRNHDYQLKELSAVRKAITSMIESISEPHVELKPLRIVVSEKLNGGATAKRTLDQLSGGYQAVLALAADLAWRMAQGNPHLKNPLESEAISLIDEVELHLHPSWQQRILCDLMRTFPNTQFIVSTHSPQILTTAKSDQIIELHREDDKIFALQTSEATFGNEAGNVLSTVMGVSERPTGNSFVETLKKYNQFVSKGQGESDAALSLRRQLEDISPDDDALDRADVEIRRQLLLKNMGKSD